VIDPRDIELLNIDEERVQGLSGNEAQGKKKTCYLMKQKAGRLKKGMVERRGCYV
jgi:hypothetical protein